MSNTHHKDCICFLCLEPEYEPYGEEWEKEMMKMNKAQLIDFIRQIKTKPEA